MVLENRFTQLWFVWMLLRRYSRELKKDIREIQTLTLT